MGKRKQKKKLSSEGLKRFIEERFVISPETLIKAAAFGSGTYLIYWAMTNPFIKKTYTEIQLSGSPILYALWKLGLFDPAKKLQLGWGQALAFSMLGSYTIVQHGDDIFGLLKNVATTTT